MMAPTIPDPPGRRHLRFLCNDAQERRLARSGYLQIAGIDEVGRGALCGPVVASAVILNLEAVPKGIDDSKKLSELKREELFEAIRGSALAVGLGLVSSQGIDDADILKATIHAMTQAVRELNPVPDYLLVDALTLPLLPIPQTGLLHGDAQCVSIAAASIIAKVTRDRMMVEFDRLYPQYGLSHNKGYGTPEHLESLRRFGPSPIHRRTFKPVSQLRLSF